MEIDCEWRGEHRTQVVLVLLVLHVFILYGGLPHSSFGCASSIVN